MKLLLQIINLQFFKFGENMKDKEYIECPYWFKTMTIFRENPAGFKIKNKVEIDKIKIDKKYFSYVNPIYEETIDSIINDFYIDAWEPIWINPEMFLLDGQHRLCAAKKMGLKYIDVVIHDEKMCY